MDRSGGERGIQRYVWKNIYVWLVDGIRRMGFQPPSRYLARVITPLPSFVPRRREEWNNVTDGMGLVSSAVKFLDSKFRIGGDGTNLTISISKIRYTLVIIIDTFPVIISTTQLILSTYR